MTSAKQPLLRQAWRRAARGLRRASTDWAAAGVNLLFPPRCACCDVDLGCEHPADRPLLCGDCVEAMGPAEWVGCDRCGAPAPSGTSAAAPCVGCRGRRFHFDTVVPLGVYRDQLRSAVLKMKRPSGEPLACALGQLLVLRRKETLTQLRPQWVAPVPMHWFRRAMRKTNSPELLAEQIALGLGAAFAPRLLRRRRNTRLQPDLAPGERFHNVRGAFEVGAACDVQGARVLLVDDVLTTGATASEAASVLRRAGADMVAVAVVARAESDDAV